MQTAAIAERPAIARAIRSRPRDNALIGWVLLIPMMFFAVGGTPSFEGVPDAAGAGSLSGLASNGRSAGLVGSVALPGLAFSIVLWLVLINSRRITLLALEMKTITLLALLTICSALWSQSPSRSAYYGLFYVIETLFAFALVLKWGPDELRALMVKVGLSLTLISLVLVILFPRIAIIHGNIYAGAWKGVFGDRTAGAKSLVFLLSPVIIFRRTTFQYRYMIYILLASVLIFMAHAMTARVTLIGYIIFMAFVRIFTRYGRRSALVISGIFLGAAASIVYVGILYMPLVLKVMGKNATLTGRTGIWSSLLVSVAKRPLLGYGYHAFWLGLTGESARVIVGAHWAFGYAHNGILEICLQLGLLGTALFFVTLFQAIANAWFCLQRGCPPGAEWYIGLIALTIMYNIDESTVLWPVDLSSILYVVACCGLAITARQIKSARTIEALKF
jgi:exopolysaccharide production protein ExoQ